eukprot:m.212027 g.212027  ORF g.212027 m.212027 type:complete len:199 (-) comp19319_c0_seq1:1355-1951(-)
MVPSQHPRLADQALAKEPVAMEAGDFSPLTGDDGSSSSKVDPARQRFPFCVVWTPLPLITWIFPFIGHTGICSSSGVIYDFAGPYTINEDHMAFGKPTKYWQLSPANVSGLPWDTAVRDGGEEYRKRMHNLCCDNCHSHVAYCLNLMQYRKSASWNMFTIGLMMTLQGRYISVGHFVRTWLPFCIIVLIIALVSYYKS